MLPLAAIVLLSGCSKSDEGGAGMQGDPVAIRLNSGIMEVATKAAVDAGSSFTASVAGWETEGTVDYTTSERRWYNTATITATTAVPGSAVTLNPARYYHANDNIKTYMKGWYPAGEPTDGVVTFENTDGTVDPMITAAVSGSKTDAGSKNLVFNHPTTQIKFEVVAGTGLASDTKVRSISIHNAQLPTGFDLSDNSLSYASAATLSVPHLSETAITATATAVGAPVMIKPFAGRTMTLDVTTSHASFSNVTATIDEDTDFQPGKAYTITLTFSQKEIVLTATVTAWDNTGSGSATIE